MSQRVAEEVASYLDANAREVTLNLTGESLEGGGMGMGLTAPRAGAKGGTAYDQSVLYNTSFQGITDRQRDIREEKLRQIGHSMFSAGDYYYKPVDTKDSRYRARARMANKDPEDNFISKVGVAVVLSDVPTSSSNYKRPRTLAAGYDMDLDTEEGTVTVLFRDGTFWNYYNVPKDVWIKFHSSISKGPFLNQASAKQGSRGDLLNYVNGPARLEDMSEKAREAMIKMIRVSQVSNTNRPKSEKARFKRLGYASFDDYGREITYQAVQNGRPAQRRNILKSRPTRSAAKPTTRNTSALRKK
jgi:hypothetical protein